MDVRSGLNWLSVVARVPRPLDDTTAMVLALEDLDVLIPTRVVALPIVATTAVVDHPPLVVTVTTVEDVILTLAIRTVVVTSPDARRPLLEVVTVIVDPLPHADTAEHQDMIPAIKSSFSVRRDKAKDDYVPKIYVFCNECANSARIIFRQTL